MNSSVSYTTDFDRQKTLTMTSVTNDGNSTQTVLTPFSFVTDKTTKKYKADGGSVNASYTTQITFFGTVKVFVVTVA